MTRLAGLEIDVGVKGVRDGGKCTCIAMFLGKGHCSVKKLGCLKNVVAMASQIRCLLYRGGGGGGGRAVFCHVRMFCKAGLQNCTLG